ncbi:hypothetical protein FDV58_11355 [Bradyrhizobium elkanii]|uniref:Uncharacterized protein n=1 Tax=Bradyrhizobium elkanii TaxID=29448 RepID=A0A4V6CXR4_BRAEL|nr:hypothetical protein [Bradyrhizobium sp. BR2003]TKV81475.1 hypothetical protein FDV58_11355 [Bradyrhizobium elkanii]
MGTGSREENASNRESRAPFRFNRNGISSRGMAALAPHPQRAVTERCLRGVWRPRQGRRGAIILLF